MTVAVVRSADRGRTRTATLDSRHAFSYGHHYDPTNTSYGLLLAHNEDLLAAGGGFPLHPHRSVEVVTWVLAGELTHADSTGNRGVVRPGTVQRMSAGTGVQHAETNEGAGPVHYVQTWVEPDAPDAPPTYARAAVDLVPGTLVPVASGLPAHAGTAAVTLGQRAAGLLVGRLPAGAQVRLPPAPWVHVHVARGRVRVAGEELEPGDAVRLTGEDGPPLQALDDAEVLVWEMHARLG